MALTFTLFVGAVSCRSQGLRERSAERIEPSELVCIPAGEFIMGKDEVGKTTDCSPAHRVNVSGFCPDQCEVNDALPANWRQDYTAVAPDAPL